MTQPGRAFKQAVGWGTFGVWQFLKAIHLSEELGDTPVIVVSAVTADTEGAVRSMRKPVDIEDLLEAVRTYC